MKIAMIIILIFSVLAISFTATMLQINKQNISSSTENEDYTADSIVSTSSIVNTEKQSRIDSGNTLNLFSTFNEPSINFATESINLGSHYGTVEMTQIRGLKNKNVEKKINDDIKERYLNKIIEIEKENNITINQGCILLHFNTFGLLPNVFSAKGNVVYKDDITSKEYFENKNNYIYLNYELLTGERLHIEDLFVKNFDISYVISSIVNSWLENTDNVIRILC